MEKNYDVIVVGTGASGLYATLNLSHDLKILLITKRDIKLCNSSLAQGGVAAIYHPTNDNIQLHTNDTLIAGGFKNDLEATKVLVTQAEQEIQEIIDYGVEFDKNPDGTLHRTLEGGHCRNRIFHHKDATGFEIVQKLSAAVKELDNVDIMEYALLCDVKKTDTGFSVDILKDGEHRTFNSHYCILGTGGIGRVYEYTTNSAIATGDGITFAYEMGAKIKNLHFVQFHPTAFNNRHTRECFLISESVRGEGAYLLNCNYERFMHNYDDRLELAPRDVVSHAIIEESKKTGSENFYLDITHKDPEFLKERFPMIGKYLIDQGIDMTKDRIPVYPCQHYLMGGINVDTFAETSIKDLYAVGECSHTGVHGNNRLASNSLLEALVFSHRAADQINEKAKENKNGFDEYDFKPSATTEVIPKGIRTEIRRIMQKSYFVVPDMKAAVEGYERICEIKNHLETADYVVNADYIEAKSLATVAYIILKEVI